MEADALIDGLIWYCCLVVIITFHEFAHAWTAWRLGDDTARLQGRITLNPAAHMDLIGTVILPGVIILLSVMNSGLSGFIIGWGKPVPVNPGRLKNPRRDDILVSMAGPGMNVVLAVAAVLLAKGGHLAGLPMMPEGFLQLADLSLFLCFFNLLPIPPLDGSHPMRYLTGMSHETYNNLCQYGFVILILAIQIPAVRWLLIACTEGTLVGLMTLVGGFG